MPDWDSHRTPLTRKQIESGVRVANIPALLMTVYQFTGDPGWLGDKFRPTRGRGLDDNDTGGLDPEIQDEIREAAVDVFLRLQDGEAPAMEVLEPTDIVEAMAIFMGEPIAPEYGQMLATEYARRTGHTVETIEPPRANSGFRVAIVGAGVGGISAAQRCHELGIDFVLLDHSPAPGGVWWKNSYPGAGVDTPSHLYSLSFAKHDWSKHFALRDEIQQYLADALGMVTGERAPVRFNVDVRRMEWSEAEATWTLTLEQSGETSKLTVNAVICSVGGLDRPSIPKLPGDEKFEGRAFHSARWPKDLDLDGKRVVIVGTGASSMQIVTAIAAEVERLTIVQRSPQWVAPFGKFRKSIPEDLRAILAAFPLYYGWYWLRLFWQFGDNVLESLRIDPAWPHPERAVSARNDAHRKFFTAYIKERLGDRLDLLPSVLPDYPPFGKRILLDNGWYDALRRPNVELIASEAIALDREGVITAEGHHPADILVWATGFQASRFIGSVDVIGRSGRTLRDTWEENDSRSYLGVAVPGFPNFFTLGGPNSFPGSGSIMFWLELQARYVCRTIATMLDRDYASIEVKQDVHKAYNDLIDREHAQMIWTHPGMTTYYRGESGRVVFVSPFRNVDFWERLRAAGLDDFVTRPSPG